MHLQYSATTYKVNHDLPGDYCLIKFESLVLWYYYNCLSKLIFHVEHGWKDVAHHDSPTFREAFCLYVYHPK